MPPLPPQVRLEAEKAAEKERLEEEKAVVRIQKAQVRLRWPLMRIAIRVRPV